MLKISHLTKTFYPRTINEKLAINDLSLEIADGDFVTVIGGNGAGKSTLLNLIAGVFLPDEGSVILDEEDLSRQPEHKRARLIGRVFQDPMMGTAANMEIEENLAMANRRGKRRGLAWGIKPEERADYVGRLAKLDLGLEDRMHAKVGLLSGGQRQALTLLMATLVRPKLLLLDEHTAALDPKTAQKVLQVTEQIVSTDKLTTLMITHNMRDALSFGNRLIMMDRGKIIFDVRDQEKAALTVEDLLEKFEALAGDEALSDRMVLS